MRRRFYIFAAIAAVVIASIFLHRNGYLLPLQQQSLAMANATLGFGTILAVFRPHSHRLPGLLWAANLTDLQIEVPSQPDWTKDDLHSLRLDPGSSIPESSALAWLGHLHTLRTFLSSGVSTALILENDADFDLSIRVRQVPLLASNLRKVLGRANSYWPDLSTWDILYLGHCDDALPSSSNPFLKFHPHTLYTDPTTPPHTVLHPDTSNFLRALCVSEKQRILHRTLAPFCTVAYAVHRRSAELIVQRFSKEAVDVQAFDVALLRACAQGWRCWSVSPEVLHHGGGDSEISAVDSGNNSSPDGDARELGKGTWNVRCAARREQLWVEEGDPDARDEARKRVWEMLKRVDGECPVDLVKAERS